MPFFEKDGNVYLFIHVPKTGGTSLEFHLQKFSKMFFYSNLRPLPSITRVSPQHYPISVLRSIFGPNFWKQSFAIVRNPFDRVASEYNYQKRFYWPNIPSFDIWLNSMLTATKDDPFCFDNHLRPQVDFIDKTVKIFKYESGLDKIAVEIENLMGINSNKNLPAILKYDSPQIDWSSESIDKMVKFYQLDFRLLNYSVTPPVK